ncbi:MAG: MOSC N-terminal beta barrel domain-containing protein, partial [Ilumatobacteraceae bacterium]
MRVVELWRYPVKSLQGERIESCDVGEHGLVGDRAWGLVDQRSGYVLTARRVPELLMASARLVGPDKV